MMLSKKRKELPAVLKQGCFCQCVRVGFVFWSITDSFLYEHLCLAQERTRKKSEGEKKIKEKSRLELRYSGNLPKLKLLLVTSLPYHSCITFNVDFFFPKELSLVPNNLFIFLQNVFSQTVLNIALPCFLSIQSIDARLLILLCQ